MALSPVAGQRARVLTSASGARGIGPTVLAVLRALAGARDQEPKLLGVAEGGRALARRGSVREGRDEREQSARDR